MKTNKAKEIKLFDRNNKYDSDILESIGKEGDMLSLTDLWKAAGSQQNKRPIDWLNMDSTKQLIETMETIFQSGQKPLWKTKRGGKNPGTNGHKSLALAYAKYLDPALHVLVNEIFFQRIEEEKNPDLIVDRAIATYKKKGKDDKWIGQRLKTKGTRNEFTSCLASHGVDKEGFRNCTNAIYTPLYGGTTAVIREKKHLPEKVNIRDNMSLEELCAVEFAEMLSRNKINANNLQGNGQCEIACSDSSKQVAKLVVQSKINNKISTF